MAPHVVHGVSLSQPWCLPLLLLLLSLYSLTAAGFNLDTSMTLIKEGEKGSFFGFSVALHQQLTPEPHSWILVGAPRDRGLGLMRRQRTGALYRCPITGEEFDCERVDIDGDVNLDRESKDNQWLGVTVKSQGIGGKVVTCAHLYELRQRVGLPSETRDPIGRCYVLSEDLTERDDLDGGEWKFCEGRPQGHEQFGFCQQGLSAAFTPDNNFIMFGAPGTYNWKGEMRVQLLNQTLLDLGFYDDGPYEVADEKQLNAQLIPVPYHSYLGRTVPALCCSSHIAASLLSSVVLLHKDNMYTPGATHTSCGERSWVLPNNYLIVGAPNYFDRKTEIGGAVYIFLNRFGNWEYAQPIRLNGTHDSMFGLTVNNVGDLDQDGYDDIAVGAPFDGDGKVFIYRGSFSGIDTKPAQILEGVNEGVKRFGYSISGGLDIDGNLYPDLAVGSLGDKMVLYRSRPVIHVTRDVSIEPQHYIDLEQHNCKGRDGENIRDKLRPIALAITHTIRPPMLSSDTNPEEQLSPVLGVATSNTLHSEVNFLREGCGDDNICQSNLKLTYQFGTRPITSDLFTPLPKDDEEVSVFSLSDQRSVVLEVTVTNMPSEPLYPEKDGDDAHAAQLLVTLPDTLSYSGFRGQQVVCQANQNGSQAECELGNPLKRDSILKFYIILSTSAITIETTELTVNLLLATISEQPDLAPVTAVAKVVIELPLAVSGVARPHQLFFSGAVKGESAMETLDDVGSALEFEFTVTNTGPSLQTLGSAFLNIMWPHELSNGKWLLYPTAFHFKGHPETHCRPHTSLNPRKFSHRHLHHPMLQEGHKDHQGHQPPEPLPVHPADCLLGSAHCVLFQCPLLSFSGSAVLKIQGRLWNSTFLEEFPSVSALELLVRANITVKSSIKHLVLRDAAVPVMIYPEVGLTAQYWIPWWWILIAILAGILVLSLMVCILWKCGFFRRVQYEDQVPQYHAVKIPHQDLPQFHESQKAGFLHKKDGLINADYSLLHIYMDSDANFLHRLYSPAFWI
uniref:Integrin alpha-2 domain-containing protein n=1 Tax=Oncorhynchus tshawytscha TaxID=74940 RepID=A0A8C8CGA7_ONCTS